MLLCETNWLSKHGDAGIGEKVLRYPIQQLSARGKEKRKGGIYLSIY